MSTMSRVGRRPQPNCSVVLAWIAAPLTWASVVEPFDALYPVSTVKPMHVEPLSRLLALRQRDRSRGMNELL